MKSSDNSFETISNYPLPHAPRQSSSTVTPAQPLIPLCVSSFMGYAITDESR